ncbi:hypothetical protein F0562_015021 [Nyssa sinensis]|uniref:Secreted protein n=1 Tax=Nyssa sinensis TaxID=561372 RepID=A0A5J4ZU70_9ASTE|nr:hypothetical protein F0562_015021 [Nyssa sinensis]
MGTMFLVLLHLTLLLFQNFGLPKTKRGLGKPKILAVVICRRHMNYEILQALQLGIRPGSKFGVKMPAHAVERKARPCTEMECGNDSMLCYTLE